MSEIITAAITGCVTLLGVLLSNRAAQAVTDEKLTELTREVREHNHFARRVPVVEEQIRGMDRRLEQLEQGQRRRPSLEMADREEQEWIFQHLVWQAWRRSR